MAIKSNKQQTGEILAKWFAHYKKYSDVPICLVYGSGIPVVLDDGAIQCLSDYYGISDITASTQRTFTKYPSDYVKANYNFKKNDEPSFENIDDWGYADWAYYLADSDEEYHRVIDGLREGRGKAIFYGYNDRLYDLGLLDEFRKFIHYF